MPCHVEQGRAQVFGRGETLVERSRALQLLDQILRHRRSGLIVLRIVRENRRLQSPVLVELRGEFDEVARHGRTADRWVLHVREHTVQCMAELVKHRRHVSEREERGLACSRLCEVLRIRDHRFRAEESALADEAARPRAAGFVRPGEKVRVEKRQRFAVGIEHIEHAHVGLVDGDVVPLLECDAVELRGGEEDAVFQNVIQLEVRPYLPFVEVELGLPYLLRVELPVPRLEREAAFLRVDELLHARRLAARFRGRRRDQVGHQLDGVFRRLRHLVVEVVGRVRRITEKLCALRSELSKAGDDGFRVVVAAVIAAGDRCIVETLAEVAILQVGLRRLLGGVLQREQPLALQAARFGPFGGRGDIGVGQAVEEHFVVDDDGRSVRVGQNAIAELCCQLRLLLIESPQRGLVGLIELRAGADEVLVVALHQKLRLGVEAQRAAAVVKRFDPREKLRVEIDGVAVCGQLRRNGGLYLLQCWVRVRLRYAGEDTLHATEHIACALHRLDRVRECRGVGVVGDGLDLRQLARHPLLDSRLEIAVLDAIEGRRLER